jgi:hypothetical protein
MVAFATLRAVPVTTAFGADVPLVPFAADETVAAVAFRATVGGLEDFAVLAVFRQRVALVVLAAPAAVTAVVVAVSAALPLLAPAVAADLALAAAIVVPTLDAVAAFADAPLAVLVVTALGLANAAAAVAIAAIPIAAALGAVAALGLVVVAAVQAVAAGAVEGSVGRRDFHAPVASQSAAPLVLIDTMVVARLVFATDFVAVAGGDAPIVIAVLAGAADMRLIRRRYAGRQQTAAFAIDTGAIAADFALATMRVITAFDADAI